MCQSSTPWSPQACASRRACSTQMCISRCAGVRKSNSLPHMVHVTGLLHVFCGYRGFCEVQQLSGCKWHRHITAQRHQGHSSTCQPPASVQVAFVIPYLLSACRPSYALHDCRCACSVCMWAIICAQCDGVRSCVCVALHRCVSCCVAVLTTCDALSHPFTCAVHLYTCTHLCCLALSDRR